jgi:hypothetical protein
MGDAANAATNHSDLMPASTLPVWFNLPFVPY